MPISRRRLLLGSALSAASIVTQPLRGQPRPTAPEATILTARQSAHRLLPEPAGVTTIWGYEGRFPGPELRVRQGEMLRVKLVNELPQPTTIHWHGLRLPNAMDGVPGMTQAAVSPGASFDYAFAPPDAGTYWYHPHANSSEQVERGLAGLLIVEERTPPTVDRDVSLLLKDFLIDREGRIVDAFDDRMAAMHDGRLGNLLTVNGAPALHEIVARANERLRLRICNASNARILPIRCQGTAYVVALDGQPSEVFEPIEGVVVLAPGNRVDLIIDAAPAPEGGSAELTTVVHGRTLTFCRVRTAAEAPLRPAPLARPAALPANPVVTRLDLARARRVSLVFEGGAMMRPGGAMSGGGHRHGPHNHGNHNHPGGPGIWTLNGRSSDGHSGQPLFRVRRGTTVVLAMENRTAFPHGMHIHGHHLRPLDRADDGWKPWLLDTVLLMEQEAGLFAFVADNPGKWMIHCHMLEHQATGMAAWFEVT